MNTAHKLNLDSEVVRDLSGDELDVVAGGTDPGIVVATAAGVALVYTIGVVVGYVSAKSAQAPKPQ